MTSLSPSVYNTCAELQDIVVISYAGTIAWVEMSFSKNTWAQLKNRTAADLVAALMKDGFELDENVRTERIYRHFDGRRVSIHWHRGNKSYGPGLLKALLEDAGWSESDLRRLKLIR